jgi:hypothetical protein
VGEHEKRIRGKRDAGTEKLKRGKDRKKVKKRVTRPSS